MTRASGAERRLHAGRPPALLLPPALLGVLFLALPVIGLLLAAPWSGLAHIYAHADTADGVDVAAALKLSLMSSLEATILSLLLGVPIAWVLARVKVRGIALLRVIVTLPLVVPPVVGGLALLLTYGRTRFVGEVLYNWFGLFLPFSVPAVVMAQAFVAMPFLVVTMEGAFRTSDQGLEEAAATLGASRLRVLTRVTLPLVIPSLIAGTVLCWARALGEFGATILFAGNVMDHTQTSTTAIYSAFQINVQDAVALSLPLMLVAVVILVALRDKWLRPLGSA